jgi:hypothetical protein
VLCAESLTQTQTRTTDVAQLVADADGPSIMVRGLMLARRARSVVSVPVAVALCVAVALSISIALGVTVALCVPVPTCVLGWRALRSGLALRSRGAADS